MMAVGGFILAVRRTAIGAIKLPISEMIQDLAQRDRTHGR
jgi:hypothetical protein